MDTKLLGLILQGDKRIAREITDFKNILSDAGLTESGAIVQTAAGESIVTNDSSDDSLKGLRVFGKSEQFSTTGANLLDIRSMSIINGNGLSSVINDDGSVTVNGTPSYASANALRTNKLKLEPGTYYISGGNNTAGCLFAQVMYSKADGTRVYRINNSFTLDGSETDFSATIQCGADMSPINNYTIYPMLNKGSTALPYEPYTGGIPSPNPNFPQEINSAGDDGDVEVGVYGGNLLDESNVTCANTETNAYNPVLYAKKWDVEEGKTYTLSFDTENTGIGVYVNESCGLSNVGFTMDGRRHSFVLTASKTIHNDVNNGKNTVIASRGGSSGTKVGNISNVMLTLSEGYDVYEPYHKQSLPIQTPNGLPGIKVTDASLATYTDAAGNMWCADEVDFERGVYVKRIYNGSLLDKIDSCVTTDNTSNSDSILRFDFVRVFMCKPQTTVLCNRFPYKFAHGADSSEVRKTECISSHGSGDAVSVFIDKNRLTSMSVKGFKAWVEENDTTIQCILETPIETPLSEEELTAYRALHSNYPVTTVLNDSGAHMELTYNADTKSYIDNKFTELTNAILSMGGNV